MHELALPISPPRRKELVRGTAASVLLHAVALTVLLVNLGFEAPVEPPRETTVEVLLVAKEPDAPPQSATEQTRQAEATIPDLPVTERPPPPQLEEAPIAERSQPPPGPAKPQARARSRRDSAGPADVPAPAAPGLQAPKADRSAGGGAGRAAQPRAGGEGKPTQDEKDFLLAQVIPFWLIDYHHPRFRHVVFRGHFVLQADGMLQAPFGKNDPWTPETMIDGYDRLGGREHEPQRVAIESFLRAVRAAQPFRLPPGIDRQSYPRVIPVFFRLGDL